MNRYSLTLNTFLHREPCHNDDLIANYLPIQNDKFNYLKITNDGLKMGLNPSGKSYEFWTNIERKTNEN